MASFEDLAQLAAQKGISIPRGGNIPSVGEEKILPIQSPDGTPWERLRRLLPEPDKHPDQEVSLRQLREKREAVIKSDEIARRLLDF